MFKHAGLVTLQERLKQVDGDKLHHIELLKNLNSMIYDFQLFYVPSNIPTKIHSRGGAFNSALY